MRDLNHKYTINLPDKIYKTLRFKAADESKSMKEIIISCITETLGDVIIDEAKNNLAFLASSNKILGDEWNSKEDDEAFKSLQKYNKPKH
jgi:hypothetical protein